MLDRRERRDSWQPAGWRKKSLSPEQQDAVRREAHAQTRTEDLVQNAAETVPKNMRGAVG